MTTSFAENLYIFGEINHFAGVHQGSVQSEWDPSDWESMQQHLTLMDLMALLCVAEEKHSYAAVSFKLLKTNTYGIDIIFSLNSPASKVTTDFIEAVQCYLDQLLQDRINHTVARLEISRLVFHHCREKMVARFKKLIAAISAISVEELINHFPNKGQVATALSSSPELVRDDIVQWLETVRSKSLKLDEDSHFSIMYACYIIGYTSGILNDDFSVKCEAASKRIRKLGDYYRAIYRIVDELISVRRGAGFTLSIREVVSREPQSVVLNGSDVLSILNRWAGDHRYDDLTVETLEKAYPLVKRDALVRPFLTSTELSDPGKAAKARNIKLTECAHAECSIVMERVKEVIEGRAKIKKSSVVIEVGVSKSVCWTCSRFFTEVNRVFGIRIAYSRRHGKVYAGWAPPECPFVSKYSLVLDAMQKAVEDEVEEIVRKANNKAKQGSSPLGFPSENIGMFGEAEKSVFTFMYVQS